MLLSDRDKVSQILRNLLSNAIKFTEEGTVILKAYMDEEQQVIFSVEDTGIGIKKEMLPKIFEEFQQGESSIARRFGGTGLGLPISQKLAELINGEIYVDSQLGKGSKFMLYLKNTLVKSNPEERTLTLQQGLDECAMTQEKDDHYLIPKTNKSYDLRLQDKKILVVDDDPKNIFVLASALEEYGAEIFEAENGREAIAVLQEHKIDLVLMDIMMPEMDGYEAMRTIRENPSWDKIPIIAITAKLLNGDPAKCIEAGADEYIAKPVDYDVLIQMVKIWTSIEKVK